MSQQVILTSGNLPAGYCWTNPQEFYNTIIRLTGAVVSGNAPNMIVSPNVPADPDALWVKTVGGYLEGLYLFQGSGWWRPHPKPPGGYERIIWTSPSDTFLSQVDLGNYDGGNSSEVLNAEGTTGPMWEMDPAFAFAFPVGIGTNSVAYNGTFSTITMGLPGGEEQHTLLAPEIPKHSHGMDPLGLDEMALLNVIGAQWEHPGNVPSNNSKLFQPFGGDPTTGLTTAHQNMPPYRGVIFARRTGRIYIKGG